MHNSYEFIITIGFILLLGLAADAIGKHTLLPRVTLLLLFGLAIGVNGFNIVPSTLIENYNVIADIALIMVGFLAGGKLSKSLMINHGLEVLLITISVVVITALIVIFGSYLAGIPIVVAILLGSISTTTDPAATLDVIIESKKTGVFIDRLTAIVALDDFFGLILFSLCLSVLPYFDPNIELLDSPIFYALKDVIGAILLGVLIGFPAAYLTGRINPGQPLLLEALGLILLCGGIAIMLDVSYLISAIVMGAVVANYAKHHEYSFHEIENIEWPIMIIFFIFAGASIQLVSLREVLPLILLYILFRVLGKILGGYIGCKITYLDDSTSRWMGFALIPQAGLAIGMALVAIGYVPEYKDQLMTVIICTTIIFEMSGPVLTRLSIHKTTRGYSN